MPRPIDPNGGAQRARRHEFVTSLQVLTLTAEQLALDLRNGYRTIEQVEARSLALATAMDRVMSAARQIPDHTSRQGTDESRSLAGSQPVLTMRAFVRFITHHARRPDIERDILAEYVDHLHRQSAELIRAVDEQDGS